MEGGIGIEIAAEVEIGPGMLHEGNPKAAEVKRPGVVIPLHRIHIPTATPILTRTQRNARMSKAERETNDAAKTQAGSRRREVEGSAKGVKGASVAGYPGGMRVERRAFPRA
mmetsp:Transcript_26143/g.63012  ORF Transcript_26143/g.63012 Transcript_26143/m.63012 type:complete len:112 (+) Transcript_26143:1572-1907(+)